MKKVCETRLIAIALIIAAVTFVIVGVAARPICAVSCGATGATVKVVVDNQGSAVTGVRLRGNVVAGVTTCTDANSSYDDPNTPLSNGENVFYFHDLNAGQWVHRITVNNTGGANVYDQYQKGMVFKATNDPNDPNEPVNPAKPFSEVDWTYFANSYRVGIAGDANTGTCTTNCTFREAVTTVNTLTTDIDDQALIYFTTSPGSMDPNQPGLIEIEKPYVTIDGTNSSGNPWIAGDTFGSQDSFPTTINLSNAAHLKIGNDFITIKGLEISNSTGGGIPQSVLLDDSGEGTRIEATRIDGGAGAITDCTGGCDDALVTVVNAGTVVKNVEARNAFGSAIVGNDSVIEDSWFHNNLATGVEAVSAIVTRSLIELSGFNASNDVINENGDGLGGGGTVLVHAQTERNVIRNNARHGIIASASSTTFSLNHDYVCGNDSVGASINLVNSSSEPGGTGITAAYNVGYGVEITGLGGEAMLNDDSAFTANTNDGLRNSSSGSISAKNNQWRDVVGTCTGSADISGSSVDCDPAQDYLDVNIDLDDDHPVFPTNVIRTGQAVRLQGTGFNAIDGNPESNDPNDCVTGASADADNCCRETTKANECNLSDPNDPLAMLGAGNCVAFRDRADTWNGARPVGVTPTTLTLGLPGSIACIGEHEELVRAIKLNSIGTPLRGTTDYCTNADPK